MSHLVSLSPPTPGPGYDVYWSFASARQDIYLRRLRGGEESLTSDPVLATRRFTNAYRASDRVSQYLITEVIYDRDRTWLDTFTRVLIFKVFNRISTWLHIQEWLGDLCAEHLMTGAVDHAVAMLAGRQPVYSAAYIMPSPKTGIGPKSQRHLELLRRMVRDRAHERIADARSMFEAYSILAAYESIGPFLAYQFVIDLNYTQYLHLAKTSSSCPGPGALRGLRKCIADPWDLSPADVIRWVVDAQATAFQERGLPWHDLWGRELQLIDAQNLF